MNIVAQTAVSSATNADVSYWQPDYIPGVWFTGELKNGRVLPVKEPDHDGNTVYGYYTFMKNRTFTYFALNVDGTKSHVTGTWNFTAENQAFSLLFLKDRFIDNPYRPGKIKLNEQYDYKVLHLSDSSTILTPFHDESSENFWVLLKGREIDPKLISRTDSASDNTLLIGSWEAAGLDRNGKLIPDEESGHMSVHFSKNYSYQFDRQNFKFSGTERNPGFSYRAAWHFDPSTNILSLAHGTYFFVSRLDHNALILREIIFPDQTPMLFPRYFLRVNPATDREKEEQKAQR